MIVSLFCIVVLVLFRPTTATLVSAPYPMFRSWNTSAEGTSKISPVHLSQEVWLAFENPYRIESFDVKTGNCTATFPLNDPALGLSAVTHGDITFNTKRHIVYQAPLLGETHWSIDVWVRSQQTNNFKFNLTGDVKIAPGATNGFVLGEFTENQIPGIFTVNYDPQNPEINSLINCSTFWRRLWIAQEFSPLGTKILALCDDQLFLFDNTGKQIWSMANPPVTDFTLPPIYISNDAVFVAFGSTIYIVNGSGDVSQTVTLDNDDIITYWTLNSANSLLVTAGRTVQTFNIIQHDSNYQISNNLNIQYAGLGTAIMGIGFPAFAPSTLVIVSNECMLGLVDIDNSNVTTNFTICDMTASLNGKYFPFVTFIPSNQTVIVTAQQWPNLEFKLIDFNVSNINTTYLKTIGSFIFHDYAKAGSVPPIPVSSTGDFIACTTLPNGTSLFRVEPGVASPLYSLNPKGTPSQWSTDFPSQRIFMTVGRQVLAFHSETGNLLWNTTISQSVTNEIICVNNILFVPGQLSVFAIPAQTGNEALEISPSVASDIGAFAVDGAMLYFTTGERFIYRIDAGVWPPALKKSAHMCTSYDPATGISTGCFQSYAHDAGRQNAQAVPVIGLASVFVQAHPENSINSPRLVAFDKGSFSPIWNSTWVGIPKIGNPSTLPVVYLGLLFTTMDGNVVSIDPATGYKVWEYEQPNTLTNQLIPFYDGLYVSDDSKHLFSLRLEDVNQPVRWIYQLPGNANIIYADKSGILIVGSLGRLTAFDLTRPPQAPKTELSQLDPLWEFDVPTCVTQSLFVRDATVYLQCNLKAFDVVSYKLILLNLLTGEELLASGLSIAVNYFNGKQGFTTASLPPNYDFVFLSYEVLPTFVPADEVPPDVPPYVLPVPKTPAPVGVIVGATLGSVALIGIFAVVGVKAVGVGATSAAATGSATAVAAAPSPGPLSAVQEPLLKNAQPDYGSREPASSVEAREPVAHQPEPAKSVEQPAENPPTTESKGEAPVEETPVPEDDPSTVAVPPS